MGEFYNLYKYFPPRQFTFTVFPLSDKSEKIQENLRYLPIVIHTLNPTNLLKNLGFITIEIFSSPSVRKIPILTATLLYFS